MRRSFMGAGGMDYAMTCLWIRVVRAVHVWTGRRLQRHAVRRLVRHIEAVLHEEGKRARWN